MNRRLLGPTVSDWLQKSDAPPRHVQASVRMAVARAAETRQAGRRWTLPRPLRSSPVVAASVAVLVLLVLAGLFSSRLVPRGDDPAHVVGVTASDAPASAGPAAVPVRWRTEVVKLHAGDIRLDVNDLAFRPGDRAPMVGSDPGDPEYWTLEIEWFEHGVGQRWYVYFASDGRDWWVSEMRTYDGFDEGEWVYAYGPFFRTPLGRAFEGDVAIELVGSGRPGDPGNRMEATLRIEDLHLSVTPRTGSQDGPDLATRLVLDGLRTIRDGLFPRPTKAPKPPKSPEPVGPLVEVQAGDLTLTGELLDEGIVRVIDDGAGNKLQPVVSVALADDGTLWVARHKAIFALGRRGEVKVDDGGPGRSIERIEAAEDGSLIVHADGVWRLDGRTWTQLEPAATRYAEDGHGRVTAELADGSTWRRSYRDGDLGDASTLGPAVLELRLGDEWVPFELDEIFPSSLDRYPDEYLEPVTLQPSPSGDVWTYSRRGLARFDGESWTETTPDELARLAGGEVVVRDALVDEEGTLWTLVDPDGEATHTVASQQLLRLAGGTWSSFPLPGELDLDGESRSRPRERFFYGLAPVDGAGVRLLENDPVIDYTYTADGLAYSRQLSPHDAVATADGSVFGTARPRREGLLMVPSGELRYLDQDPAD